MDNLKPIRLSELKTQATFLLKSFREKDVLSANRLLKVHPFTGLTAVELFKEPQSVKLKHAYAALVLENGFVNWESLRNEVIEKDCLYNYCCVAYVHSWFKDYASAKKYFDANGGYLLSFWKDYIVCGDEYISCLGLGAFNSLWQKIGFNWVEPKDNEAYSKLKLLARENYLLHL